METTTESVTAVNLMKFERETCSRCGGSGHYSYCQMYGTKCFKCLGKGQALTKRGAVANAYCEGLRSKSASELQVGDTIKTSVGWGRVIAISPDVQEGSSLKNGEMVPYRIEGLKIETTKITLCLVNPEAMYQLLLSAEEQRDTLAKAIEYQSMLTKAGTLRKKK